MRISRKEIDAAMFKLSELTNGAPVQNPMIIHQVLEAAYLVRKARKAAKREKASDGTMPEQDPAYQTPPSLVPKGDTSATPKPLTIEAGKSYRTRDGQRVDIAVNDGSDKYCLGGKFYSVVLPRWWTIDGCYTFGRTHDLDLISEWKE